MEGHGQTTFTKLDPNKTMEEESCDVNKGLKNYVTQSRSSTPKYQNKKTPEAKLENGYDAMRGIDEA